MLPSLEGGDKNNTSSASTTTDGGGGGYHGTYLGLLDHCLVYNLPLLA